jgi:hypothetical protein
VIFEVSDFSNSYIERYFTPKLNAILTLTRVIMYTCDMGHTRHTVTGAYLALARLYHKLPHVQGIQGAHKRGGTAGENSLHSCMSLADATCSTIRMATWLVRDHCHIRAITIPLTRLPIRLPCLTVVGHHRR